jgi:sugar/nucleoside kinase (ribokinase family)
VREAGCAPVERLGGAPAFAAAALRASRRVAVILTKGGSPALRAPLMACGFEVVVGPGEATFTSELEVFGDGERHHVIAALGEPFTPADVAGWMAPALARASTVVVGAQWRDDFRGETLAALAGDGRTVFLDAQGPGRAPSLGPVRLEGPLEPAWVAGVHALKCSEEEADALLGGTDFAATQRSGLPLVVVTHGYTGATLFDHARETTVAGEPVFGLADTVGAGDSFLALMAAATDDGASPVEAAQSACDGVSAILRARREGGGARRLTGRPRGGRGAEG